MAAKVFVDTNVLVYSRDASEPPKQAQAMDWLRHLWNTRTGRLSYQVLQEFLPYHYLMRRQGREYYKTGTLNGVSTRAGYIKRTDGKFYRYVIMFNTPGKSTNTLILRLLRILD